MKRILCIVEGHGERTAVPTLVQRMLRHLRRDRRFGADVERVLVAKSGDRIVQPFDPERQLGVEWFVRRAARERPAGILVVVDAEDRCVARASTAPPLGPALLARARAEAGEIPVAVVVANRMFEAWFLADAHRLRDTGHFVECPWEPLWKSPEQIGGCKSHVETLLGSKYRETVDQPRLAEHVALPLRKGIRRRAPSFARLLRAVDQLTR